MERIKNLEILQLIQELGLVETGETALRKRPAGKAGLSCGR